MRHSFGLIAAFGLLVVGGVQFFYFQVVAHLSVGVVLLLEYFGIVFVVGWLWLWYGKKPCRLTVVGFVVVVGGLVLVFDLFGSYWFDLVGVLWGLVVVVGLVVYFLISVRDGGSDLFLVVLVFIGMTVGVAALLLLGVVGVLFMHVTAWVVCIAGYYISWLVFVLGLSLVVVAAVYLFGIHVVWVLGVTLVSFVGFVEVLFVVLFAWLLLG